MWQPAEVEQLIREAWASGFCGLAVAVAIAYDSELQPADVRALTPRQRHRDDTGTWFETRRAKTGKRAFATLSQPTVALLDDYLASLGCIVPADQPLLRNRSSAVYTKDKLAADFRAVRSRVFPGDQRRLQDLRRTGNVEAAVGGALPQDLAAKAGNTIATSSAIYETYTPVQLAAVRRADEARTKGRAMLHPDRKRNGQAGES